METGKVDEGCSPALIRTTAAAWFCQFDVNTPARFFQPLGKTLSPFCGFPSFAPPSAFGDDGAKLCEKSHEAPPEPRGDLDGVPPV
jgi:hypothetical protein